MYVSARGGQAWAAEDALLRKHGRRTIRSKGHHDQEWDVGIAW